MERAVFGKAADDAKKKHGGPPQRDDIPVEESGGGASATLAKVGSSGLCRHFVETTTQISQLLT